MGDKPSTSGKGSWTQADGRMWAMKKTRINGKGESIVMVKIFCKSFKLIKTFNF